MLNRNNTSMSRLHWYVHCMLHMYVYLRRSYMLNMHQRWSYAWGDSMLHMHQRRPYVTHVRIPEAIVYVKHASEVHRMLHMHQRWSYVTHAPEAIVCYTCTRGDRMLHMYVYLRRSYMLNMHQRWSYVTHACTRGDHMLHMHLRR